MVYFNETEATNDIRKFQIIRIGIAVLTLLWHHRRLQPKNMHIDPDF